MKGTTIAFISVAFLSSYAIFGKLLLNNISPFMIVVLTEMLAGIILILVLDLVKKIKEVEQISKQDLKFMCLISLLSAIGGPLLFLLGLRLTSATNSILINRSEVVFLSLLAVLVLKEKITKKQVFGAGVIFFGIFVIVTKNFTIGMSLNLGDVLIFLSALFYAGGTIIFKKFMQHLPPEVITTLRNLLGASLLFVISLFLVDYSTVLNSLSVEFVLALLGLVIFATIVGQYLWYKALEMTSASNVSFAGLSSPLLSISYAVILLKEPLIHSQIVGGFFIILGLIILEFHFKDIHTPEKHKHHLKFKHWPYF